MPASKAQRVLTAERRRKAVAARLAGADYDTIARTLGYASRGAAHTDISRALEASLREQSRSVEILRHELVLTLMRVKAAMWTGALAGDPRSADIVLKACDRIERLTVGNTPVRLEVITMSAIEEEIRLLSEQLAAEAADEGVPIEPGLGGGLMGGSQAGAST